MSRPRIRFQHQELDLPLGATLIGRDPECHVTLDDPLVSRRHARIFVGSDRVVVEDLGSRNGVLLNGRCIRGPAALRDADRVRVGAQCFVYCEVEGVPPSLPSRPTAELGLCAVCRLPYPLQVAACPDCGAIERVDDDTLVEPKPAPAPGASGTQPRTSSVQAAVPKIDATPAEIIGEPK
jgi:predicted component of type VI protein secretion system